ncbi:Uncharacterized protein OBRU01_01732, partial [Operophtera brumata]
VLFADVIKNISRVNNVLQDLINNYEQLQNIYKSQENVKSEDSDSEMDEVFKTKKKEAKRSKNEATTEPEPPPDKSRVTQMFWSDHEEDANSGVDTSKEAITEKETIKQTENKIDITIKPKIQIERTYRNTTTLKPVTSSESKSSDESSDTSTAEENIEKNPERLKILKPLAKPKQPQAESSDSSATEDIIEKKHESLNIMKLAKSKQPEAESSDSSATEEKIEKRPESIRILKLERPKHQPDAEILFIDTHKKPKPVIDEHKKHKMVKPTPQISNNNNYFEIPPNPKTRYNKVQHNVVKGKLAVPNKSPNDDLNYSIKVKKVMYSERFSPAKIWNDIINNLPIHLEAHSEVIKQAFSTFNKNKSKFSLRRKDVKPAPGNFTKSKNNKKENNEEVSSNEVSSKEVQTNILRDAYAETCLKVVVRKCYKNNKKENNEEVSSNEVSSKEVQTNILRDAYAETCLKVVVRKCYKVGTEQGLAKSVLPTSNLVLSAFGSNCKTGCIKEFQGDEKKIKTKPTLVPVLVRRSQTKPTPVSVLVRRSQTKPTPVPVVRRPKAEERKYLARPNAICQKRNR